MYFKFWVTNAEHNFPLKLWIDYIVGSNMVQ